MDLNVLVPIAITLTTKLHKTKLKSVIDLPSVADLAPPLFDPDLALKKELYPDPILLISQKMLLGPKNVWILLNNAGFNICTV